VSTQHRVKVAPTKVCRHQVGHGTGDDEHRRGGCVWLQNGCNRMRYRVGAVYREILFKSDMENGGHSETKSYLEPEAAV
jgi:hypothetical protein